MPIQINCVQDLLVVLERSEGQVNQTVWYRGQGSAEWPLIPYYLRLKGSQSESTLLKRFKQSAAMLIENHPKNYFDWIFLMQHYGVPTRLLDWSESPLIALYFAVENLVRDGDIDGALWLLSPSKLNRNAHITDKDEYDYIPSFDDQELQGYSIDSLNGSSRFDLFPVATIATRNNPRLQAQLGVFTIHHRDITPIEEVGDGSHVEKLIIPSESKERIKKQLSILGYSKFQLFPELSSIGDIIKESFQ